MTKTCGLVISLALLASACATTVCLKDSKPTVYMENSASNVLSPNINSGDSIVDTVVNSLKAVYRWIF